MESRAEFNLTEEIEVWRLILSKKPGLTGDNIKELQSHLLDEMDHLQEIGLSKEESFFIAQKRIGSLDQLADEFNKVNKKEYFQSKVLPYLIGILLFVAFMNTTELLTNTFTLIGGAIGIDNSYLSWFTIGILTFLTLLIFVLSYGAYKRDKLNIKRIKNIPLLVTFVIISKGLIVIFLPFLSRSIDMANWGLIHMNLSVYKLSLIVIFLTMCCIFHYSSKQEERMKVVE